MTADPQLVNRLYVALAEPGPERHDLAARASAADWQALDLLLALDREDLQARRSGLQQRLRDAGHSGVADSLPPPL